MIEKGRNIMFKKILYTIILIGFAVLVYFGINRFIGYQKQIEDALAALNKRQEELKKEREELERIRKEMEKTDKKMEDEIFVTKKGDKT